MQMHGRAHAAPALMRRDVENSGFCMQSHAAYACMAIFLKKASIFGAVYADFVRVCAACRHIKI